MRSKQIPPPQKTPLTTPLSVWTARSKQTSSSRTPTNRSNNASPAQQTNPTQKPAQQPPANVWAQRASQVNRDASNGPSSGNVSASGTASPTPGQAVGAFNAAEVKAFLAREAGVAPAPYKVVEAAGGKSGGAGGAWGGGKPQS